MKISKVAPAAASMHQAPELEALFLKHKHLGLPLDQIVELNAASGQQPLGAVFDHSVRGGNRKHGHKNADNEDVRAMMMPHEEAEHARLVKGGHGVPLSGELQRLACVPKWLIGRLLERAVLCADHHRYPSPGVQGRP